MIKTRIAPSPTGAIHIGLARTALYNFFYSRNKKGKFLLRIEDTDRERSTEASLNSIIEGFKWLGIEWDEGPFFQSQRFGIYKRFADKLIEENKAYRCFCSTDRLRNEREQASKEGRAWKYDRLCLNLTDDEIERKLKAGDPYVIRFFIPNGESVYNDLIHGEIRKKHSDIEDFVIMRSDESFTYNFSVVVDDALMGITHVIRGVEHINNTFKQILLYKALGFNPPLFAHLPLILGPDKKKLSKRHGASSIDEYRQDGIISKALVNYLTLLGWSPGDNREIMDLADIIALFDVKRVKKSNAVFDKDKLLWMNSMYIKEMDIEALSDEVLSFIKHQGINGMLSVIDKDRDYFYRVLELIRDRATTLVDLIETARIYLFEDYDIEKKAMKYIKTGIEHLKLIKQRYEALEVWDKSHLEEELRALSEERGEKAGLFIHPVRAALTGRKVGPPLFDIIEVLGKIRTIKRLDRVINMYII